MLAELNLHFIINNWCKLVFYKKIVLKGLKALYREVSLPELDTQFWRISIFHIVLLILSFSCIEYSFTLLSYYMDVTRYQNKFLLKERLEGMSHNKRKYKFLWCCAGLGSILSSVSVSNIISCFSKIHVTMVTDRGWYKQLVCSVSDVFVLDWSAIQFSL